MNAIEIRSVVDQLLDAARVKYSVRYVGETARENMGDKPWKCDAWRVTFKPETGAAYETDYFTGLGHRTPTKSYVNLGITGGGKPQAPKAADVLYSLVLDATADSQSFYDWCSDSGMSDDSITAFETYRACCETGRKLRAMFKPETLAAIRDAVQEL